MYHREAVRPKNSRFDALESRASATVATTFTARDEDARDTRLSRLTTLLEVARMLNSELDLSEIVRQVLVRAIDAIPACDAGTLYLEDPTSGRLVVKDSVGFGPSIFKLSLKLGEGAAGRAVLSGRGAVYNSREAVLAVVADASPDTVHYFHEASAGPRAPHAAASVPLIYKGKAVGALVVDAFQNKGGFDPEDLEMLEHFAQIAAIAIVNARLYESEHASRIRLEVLNNEITRQKGELERRLAAIDAMAQLARQGLGLGALAALLANLTCSRVSILDGLTRTRAVEPATARLGCVSDLLESKACVDLLDRVGSDFQPRWAACGDAHVAATPIVGGADLLGYVVVEGSEPETALVTALSEMAALVASSVFVRERALEEGVVRNRVDLLETLLDGNVPRSSQAFQSLPPPLRLAVGKIRNPRQVDGAAVGDVTILREACSIAQQVLKTQSVPIVAAVRGDCIVIGWSTAQRDGKFQAKAKLEDIASQVTAATGMRIRFVLSEVAKDPMLIPQLFNEARLAAGLRPWTDDVVIDTAGLGAYRLIIGAVSSGQAVAFSRQTLGKVIAHDSRNNGNLVETLRTYLARSSSLSLTARALGVHVHTVRYRLTKLEELTGLSLLSTEDRLTLELAFRILALAGPAEAITS